MASRCVLCGAPLSEAMMQCGRCRASFPDASSMDRKLVRRRRSIPLVAILTIGFLGALAFGAGKLATAHTIPTTAAVTASVNGKAVPVGGPAIALLEQQFSANKVHVSRSGSERPIK